MVELTSGEKESEGRVWMQEVAVDGWNVEGNLLQAGT